MKHRKEWAIMLIMLVISTSLASCNKSKTTTTYQRTAEEQLLIDRVKAATTGGVISEYTDGQIDIYNLSMQPVDTVIAVSLLPEKKKKTIELLSPEEELQLLMIKLEGKRFQHQIMPRFTAPLQKQENWQKYIHFVDSLLPKGLQPDCYLLEEDSLRFRCLNDDRKESNIYLCLRPHMLVYKDVVDGLTDTYVSTSDDISDDSITRVRMMIPMPEQFYSRSIWDIIIQHEYMHALQFLGKKESFPDAELIAYSENIALLKKQNTQTYNVLMKYGGKFYQEYGFTNELRKLCSFLYRLDEVTYLERDLMEPALLLMVAMETEKVIKTKKQEKFEKTMNNLYAYLNSDEALEYK